MSSLSGDDGSSVVKEEPDGEDKYRNPASGTVAPPWWKSSEIFPPFKKKIEEKAVPAGTSIMPSRCFKCNLDFSLKDSRFIYAHYCRHFTDRLLGRILKSMH